MTHSGLTNPTLAEWLMRDMHRRAELSPWARGYYGMHDAHVQTRARWLEAYELGRCTGGSETCAWLHHSLDRLLGSTEPADDLREYLDREPTALEIEAWERGWHAGHDEALAEAGHDDHGCDVPHPAEGVR